MAKSKLDIRARRVVAAAHKVFGEKWQTAVSDRRC